MQVEMVIHTRLAGVFNNSGFANYTHLDFARVAELGFYATGQILGHLEGVKVGNCLGINKDPYLTARAMA